MIKEASIYFKVTNFRNPPYEVNVTVICIKAYSMFYLDTITKRDYLYR